MDRSEIERLDNLGQTVRSAHEIVVECSASRDDLRARILADGGATPGHRRCSIWAISTAGAVAVLSALLLASWPQRPVTFTVGHGGVVRGPGDWVFAKSTPVPVRFSDGSLVKLSPNATARIARADRTKVQCQLEQGQASFDVVRRKGSSWEILAGPFRVVVLGTQFNLRWAPRSRDFRLELHKGSVRVTGPLVRSRQIFAGESVTISVDRDRVTLRRLNPKDGAPPEDGPRAGSAPSTASEEEIPLEERTGARASSAAPQAAQIREGLRATGEAPTRRAEKAVARPTRRGAAPDGSARRAQAKAKLRVAVSLSTRGEYREAAAALRDLDLTRVLQQGTMAELRAVADAYRLSGMPVQATETLRALRRRFPRSSAARRSAFMLGTLCFDQQRDYRGAAIWFQTYLRELPQGPLAKECLGRLIESRQRSGDTKGATSAAKTYLSKYPQGEHLNLARGLVEPRVRPESQ